MLVRVGRSTARLRSMTKGRPYFPRAKLHAAARLREEQEQKESEAAARAAPRRQSASRQRRTVAQVQTERRRQDAQRRARQRSAALRRRQEAQDRRDARMLLQAVENNRRHDIERIVDRRDNEETGELEYLIRWRGYGADRDQWRPRSALARDGLGVMLDAFDARQTSAAASRTGGFSRAFSRAFASNGIQNSSHRAFIGRNNTSVALGSSSSSSSSSSSDDSMYSADDDDDDDSDHPSDDDDDNDDVDTRAVQLLRGLITSPHKFRHSKTVGALRF